jgi:hypothetical protein
MKNITWEVKLGIVLVVSSVTLYLLHYGVFHDAHELEFLIGNDLAFLPIEVLLVSLILHGLLDAREKQERLEKLNMVIGIFFSEVGTKLLTYLSDYDPKLETIKGDLIVENNWSDDEFNTVSRKLKGYEYDVDINKLDLEQLKCFLLGRRDFMLRLSENPNLLEHETFTDLLKAVFHLTEELGNRDDLSKLPQKDREHLAGDIKRVYGIIVSEWLAYMKHLKQNYPYMFSLAMRTNPFDQKASPIICK